MVKKNALDSEQEKTPILTALKQHNSHHNANLHIPAHRQGAALPAEMLGLQGHIFQYDLTELPGLDDLHNPHQAIQQAQALAAQLYGSKGCYFLINGSSSGLASLVMASCQPGDKIILPRNVHRSVLTGVILSGAQPVYLYPTVQQQFGCVGVVGQHQWQAALQQHPTAKAVMVVRPTYYGMAADLQPVATLTHALEIPLLVDEAHGGHFSFHPQLPPAALACGADGVVQSTHKVGGSLTQTSMLHFNSSRIDQRRLEFSLAMLQTTSPSYILLASLDAARKQLALKGEAMLEQTLRVARHLRAKISALPGLKVLDKHHVGPGVALDDTRLVINVQATGLTGYQVLALLAEKYRVQVEMADNTNIICLLGLAADLEQGMQLYQALAEVTSHYQATAAAPPALLPPRAEMALTPQQAWQSPSRQVPLDRQVVGKISGDTVAVYPPGIPALCPGEVISDELWQYLTEVHRRGLHVQTSGGGGLERIHIIDE